MAAGSCSRVWDVLSSQNLPCLCILFKQEQTQKPCPSKQGKPLESIYHFDFFGGCAASFPLHSSTVDVSDALGMTTGVVGLFAYSIELDPRFPPSILDTATTYGTHYLAC